MSVSFLRDAEEHHVDPLAALPLVAVEGGLKILAGLTLPPKRQVVAVDHRLAPLISQLFRDSRAQAAPRQ